MIINVLNPSAFNALFQVSEEGMLNLVSEPFLLFVFHVLDKMINVFNPSAFNALLRFR